jgi:hypothetical protein
MMMSGTRIGIVCSMLLTFLTPLSASAQAKWKGTVVKEGDVAIVKNPKEPIYKTPILELKEELSIGGPEAKGQEVFDRIGEFIVDDAGTFYISDRKEDHIKVFDGTGRYLRTIGRHGQGPGEFEGIAGLSIVRMTGELVVYDVLQMRFSFFKTDGTYIRDLRFEEPRISRAHLDSKGNVYASATIFDMGTFRSEERTIFLNPEARDPFLLTRDERVSEPNKIEIFMPKSFWALDFSDNFIYGHSRDYEIQFFEAGTHKLIKRIRKVYDPVPVSEDDIKNFLKPGYSTIPFVFPKEHAAFRPFFLSDTGHLFVETCEKAGDGYFIHDIFDKDGRLLARMPMKPRGLKIYEGKYYALEEDEDGYQYVKRYAVTWKVK